MAYTTPPTFTGGSVLSASQLNTLSANQSYFKGIVDAPNPVNVAQVLNATGTANFAGRWTHDVLIFSYVSIGGSAGSNDYLRGYIYDDTSAWIEFYRDDPISDSEDTTEYWSYAAHQESGDKYKLLGDGTAHQGGSVAITLTEGNHYDIRFVFSKDQRTEMKVRYLYNSTGTAI